VCAQRNSEYYREYRAKNEAKIRKTRRAWERRLRIEVVKHYGSRCACCHERMLEFLTILPKAGSPKPPPRRSIFYWLKSLELPTGYVVLCSNCAGSIERNGYCPHRDSVI